MTIKNLAYRPHDLVYDPLFVVSGPKDHYKAGVIAKMSLAKYQVCPVFSNMFSDLPNYPRKQLVLRKTTSIPTYKEHKKLTDEHFTAIRNKQDDVIGADRHKFFQYPITNYPSEVIPFLHFPTFTLEKIPSYIVHGKKIINGKMNTHMQAVYRENSAQTSPWQPPYKLIHGENDGSNSPQLLKLDFLKWGSGLPAGQREVTLIERARMKRAWEKALPPVTDEATLEKRRDVIDAMERDEWAFREKEIEEVQELRMKLLEEMLNELHVKSKNRSDAKLRNIVEIKVAEKERRLHSLRLKTDRELRKLEMKHRGVIKKYRETNVIDEHANYQSELYAPQMRHGEHPMRWHQILDDRLKYYKAQFEGVENFSTLPRWLDKATIMKDDYNTAKLPGTRICMRETKWTTPVLKELHEELKNLHKTTKRRCTLRVRIDKSVSVISTPETEEIPEDEEEKYQAVVAMQSMLKGRASQILIYEGRDKCRELIQELRYSQGLLDEQREKITRTRIRIKNQQRDEAIKINQIEKLQKSLNKLEGSIVGSLLDFLNKELRRLLDERRAHAICFLNERERNDREAAEAGRRQQELRRRREHDEMFKQMVKVHQDTVDLYLQDIITEGMDFASTNESEFYLKKLVDEIEKNNVEALEQSIEVNEQEEIIADLIHHFVLPEVEKQIVRSKIKQRQSEKLRRVFDTVFDDLLPNLPEVETITESSSSDQLRPTGFKFKYEAEQELIEKLWEDKMYDLPVVPEGASEEASIVPLDEDIHSEIETISESQYTYEFQELSVIVPPEFDTSQGVEDEEYLEQPIEIPPEEANLTDDQILHKLISKEFLVTDETTAASPDIGDPQTKLADAVQSETEIIKGLISEGDVAVEESQREDANVATVEEVQIPDTPVVDTIERTDTPKDEMQKVDDTVEEPQNVEKVSPIVENV